MIYKIISGLSTNLFTNFSKLLLRKIHSYVIYYYWAMLILNKLYRYIFFSLFFLLQYLMSRPSQTWGCFTKTVLIKWHSAADSNGEKTNSFDLIWTLTQKRLQINLEKEQKYLMFKYSLMNSIIFENNKFRWYKLVNIFHVCLSLAGRVQVQGYCQGPAHHLAEDSCSGRGKHSFNRYLQLPSL